MRRSLTLLLLSLCVCLSAERTANLGPDDGVYWSVDQKGRQIIALGDLHGDPDAFFAIMTELGLMDAKGNWSGDDTILVPDGDIVSRGSTSRLILDTLEYLKPQAAAAGGLI